MSRTRPRSREPRRHRRACGEQGGHLGPDLALRASRTSGCGRTTAPPRRREDPRKGCPRPRARSSPPSTRRSRGPRRADASRRARRTPRSAASAPAAVTASGGGGQLGRCVIPSTCRNTTTKRKPSTRRAMAPALRPTPGSAGIGGLGRVAEKRHRPDDGDRRQHGTCHEDEEQAVTPASRTRRASRQFSAAVQQITSALASPPTTPTQEPRHARWVGVVGVLASALVIGGRRRRICATRAASWTPASPTACSSCSWQARCWQRSPSSGRCRFSATGTTPPTRRGPAWAEGRDRPPRAGAPLRRGVPQVLGITQRPSGRRRRTPSPRPARRRRPRPSPPATGRDRTTRTSTSPGRRRRRSSPGSRARTSSRGSSPTSRRRARRSTS